METARRYEVLTAASALASFSVGASVPMTWTMALVKRCCDRVRRHFDARSLIATAGCLAAVLAMTTLYRGFGMGGGHLSPGFAVQMAGLLVVGVLSALRGRGMSAAEGATVLVLLVVLATGGALSYESDVLRWVSAYGISAVGVTALLLLGLRWCLLLAPLTLAAQTVLVASAGATTGELVVAVLVIGGVAPLQLGYTAYLLRQLRSAHHVAEVAAAHDMLTGLKNRRGMAAAWPQVVEATAAGGARVGALVIDVDHFKLINDAHGHAAGDAVLVELGAALLAGCRADDVAVRLGGEEFAVLGGFTGIEEALAAAERLRTSASDRLGVLHPGATVSVGVALGPPGSASCSAAGWERLLADADAALYQAKAAGRDRVVVNVPLPEPVAAPVEA